MADLNPSARQVLLDLADRCEREEPSRELDGEIMFTLFAKPVGERGYLWPGDNASWSFAMRFPGKDLAWFKSVRRLDPDKETILVWRDGDPILMNDLRVLKLTSSLDAAVTLVPHHDGRRWFWRAGESSLYRGWAHLNRVHPDNCDRKDEASANAATPALALCAASLRARAEAL